MQQYAYQAKIIRVVDGDTIDAEVTLIDQDLGFHHRIVNRQVMKFRLGGINAPESGTVAGSLASNQLRSLLPIGGEVIIVTVKDKAEKYGRYLAWVYVGGKCVNDEMIESGHAVAYNPSGVQRPTIADLAQ